MKQVFLITIGFFLFIGSVSAQSCEDITSLGLGTLNSSSGEVGILAYHAPLEGYRDGMNVELLGPEGEEIWFWETSGEEGYMQTDPLIPAADSGNYMFNATVNDISVSCEATVNVDNMLELINEVETEFVGGGDLQITWSPIRGAEQYSIRALDNSSFATYSVDEEDNQVTATLIDFESNTDSIMLQIDAFSKPFSYLDGETGEEYVTPGIYELNGSISELEIPLE